MHLAKAYKTVFTFFVCIQLEKNQRHERQNFIMF